jgi:hypothetical protein
MKVVRDPGVTVNIAQVDITFGGVLVPPEHGYDGLGQLRTAGLIDAASIDPEVAQALTSSLLPTERDLPISILLGARTFGSVFQGNFVALVSPCVR